MKFDHASKGLENPLELKTLRRDIARLSTEIRSREISAMTKEELAGRSKIRLRRK
jgi:large subunit ribosomal protein L29